ncbi:MAG: STAS domain-containing protein [Candidatus Omnitrophica bacterium]|nr:hypothetical protein [bacterium]NUN95618.1 STAS domain-containing protein [Candidatus Omnitrophota bacterium]
MDRNGFDQAVEFSEELVIWRMSGVLSEKHSAEVKQQLSDLVGAGKRHLIIDFDGLQAIDSRGLSLLISIQKAMREIEGRVVFVHLNAQFAALMELTKLNRIFEIFLDMETAKRSFGGANLGLPRRSSE